MPPSRDENWLRRDLDRRKARKLAKGSKSGGLAPVRNALGVDFSPPAAGSGRVVVRGRTLRLRGPAPPGSDARLAEEFGRRLMSGAERLDGRTAGEALDDWLRTTDGLVFCLYLVAAGEVPGLTLPEFETAVRAATALWARIAARSRKSG